MDGVFVLQSSKKTDASGSSSSERHVNGASTQNAVLADPGILGVMSPSSIRLPLAYVLCVILNIVSSQVYWACSPVLSVNDASQTFAVLILRSESIGEGDDSSRVWVSKPLSSSDSCPTPGMEFVFEVVTERRPFGAKDGTSG